MRTIDNQLSFRILLTKMDILALTKTLTEELAKDPPCTSTTPDELNIKVHSFISVIDIAMTPAIFQGKAVHKVSLRVWWGMQKDTDESQKA